MSLIELLQDLVRIHDNCVEKLIHQFEKLFDQSFRSLRKRLKQVNQQVDDGGDGSKNNHEHSLDEIRSRYLWEIRNHFNKKFKDFLQQSDIIEKLVIISNFNTKVKVKEDNDRELLSIRNELREELHKLYERISECPNEKQQYLKHLQDHVTKSAKEIRMIRYQLIMVCKYNSLFFLAFFLIKNNLFQQNLRNALPNNKRIFEKYDYSDMIITHLKRLNLD